MEPDLNTGEALNNLIQRMPASFIHTMQRWKFKLEVPQTLIVEYRYFRNTDTSIVGNIYLGFSNHPMHKYFATLLLDYPHISHRQKHFLAGVDHNSQASLILQLYAEVEENVVDNSPISIIDFFYSDSYLREILPPVIQVSYLDTRESFQPKMIITLPLKYYKLLELPFENFLKTFNELTNPENKKDAAVSVAPLAEDHQELAPPFRPLGKYGM